MDEHKRNRTQEIQYVELLMQLEELEVWHKQSVLKGKHIPDEWHQIVWEKDLPKKKVPVTARFDADVVKWFRAMGQGYQGRMNRVLRAYMLSVLSKEIVGRANHDWKGAPI